MLKVYKKCYINILNLCKLVIKTPDIKWCYVGVFSLSFECIQIIDLVLFLILSIYLPDIVNSAGICLLKVNGNTRIRCELCSKLAVKAQGRPNKMWIMSKVNNKDTRRHSGVFIVNFEHISHFALVFLLLTLNM